MQNYENQFKTTALTEAITLHNELVNNDAFAGYDADKDAFDRLYKEVYIITRYELFDGADEEQIIETWFLYFEEILNGQRDCDWFEYV